VAFCGLRPFQVPSDGQDQPQLLTSEYDQVSLYFSFTSKSILGLKAHVNKKAHGFLRGLDLKSELNLGGDRPQTLRDTDKVFCSFLDHMLSDLKYFMLKSQDLLLLGARSGHRRGHRVHRIA